MSQFKNWFKIKRYNHVGRSLLLNEKRNVESFIKNKDKISHHAFFPLIKRDIKKYRYKFDKLKNKKVRKVKVRSICYATHLDSAIYSYYASIILKKHEQWLQNQNISSCVTAYRSIECDDRPGNKCNIDFSKDVFEFIRTESKIRDVAALVFDIKGFFDNLDHKILKNKWKEVCGMNEMDEATYAVYKNITRYSYVKEDDVFNLFKDKIICKNAKTDTLRKVNKKKYLRDKNAIAFCERSGIAQIRANNLIHRGNFNFVNQYYTHKGIPQGLPISAVLANVYMMTFDKFISDYLATMGGIYRRYSDDIIIVCPKEFGLEIKTFILKKIAEEEVKLEIEVSKTNLFNFSKKSDGSIICEHENQGTHKMLEYLGFSFDGNTIRLKSSGLGSYYFKMYRSIRRSIYFASHSNNPNAYGKIFENKLLLRFSKLGARKHKIFIRSRLDPKTFIESGRKSFGNYWSYVNKSEEIMASPAIRNQLRKNRNILKTLIIKAREEVNTNSINHPKRIVKFNQK